MKQISAITIYNNEGMHYDTQRRYMITLRPHASAIEYQNLMTADMCEESAFCKDFEDIQSFLLAQLSGTWEKALPTKSCFSIRMSTNAGVDPHLSATTMLPGT